MITSPSSIKEMTITEIQRRFKLDFAQEQSIGLSVEIPLIALWSSNLRIVLEPIGCEEAREGAFHAAPH